MDIIKIENGRKPFNPLDQRTEEDHAAHLKRWADFGLLNPDIMDELIQLDDGELNALRSILFATENLVILNDQLCKFMIVRGIVNDEIEFTYNEDEDPDGN